jgi:hypothetical protein
VTDSPDNSSVIDFRRRLITNYSKTISGEQIRERLEDGDLGVIAESVLKRTLSGIQER